MKNWKQAYQAVVAALPEAALAAYGERLRALVLFGSVARGAHRPDSDIDLLVIADPLPGSRWARIVEFEKVEEFLAPLLEQGRQLGAHIEFSPLIRTPAELAHGSFAFLDIPREGRFLYDPEGIARRYFEALARRLEAYGAERREIDGSPYWVLKPSARPGEPIAL